MKSCRVKRRRLQNLPVRKLKSQGKASLRTWEMKTKKRLRRSLLTLLLRPQTWTKKWKLFRVAVITNALRMSRAQVVLAIVVRVVVIKSAMGQREALRALRIAGANVQTVYVME